MRILFICNKSPFPPHEGGPIAMNAIIEGLVAGGHQVKVLAANTNKYFVTSDEVPENYIDSTGLELSYINLSIKPLDAFLNLFTKRSYHVERFISKDFKKKLTTILESSDFDVIQIEMLYMTPYIDLIRKHSNAIIVLRAHNIEHLIWERIAENCKNPLKKAYLNHLFKTLKNYELSVLEKVDGLAAITKKDAGFFRSVAPNLPVTDIPFGINPADYQYTESPLPPITLFHIGSMNWVPNLEGVRWFLEQCWQPVNQHYPALKLFLAGRHMPGWLLESTYPNVEVVGEVINATDFMHSHSVMIVPLLSGSGIRIKIIEGMANGKTVISTSIGAEGINYQDGKDILIANTPDQFLDQIGKCVKEPGICNKIGNNARHLIITEHDNDKVIAKLTEFYQSIPHKNGHNL